MYPWQIQRSVRTLAATCIVPEGETYCSEICKDSKGVTELGCDCKHPGLWRRACLVRFGARKFCTDPGSCGVGRDVPVWGERGYT